MRGSTRGTWPAAPSSRPPVTAAVLPEEFRDKITLNPENLFVATVASVQMRSWWDMAFQMGIEVDTYRDPTANVLKELSEGVNA